MTRPLLVHYRIPGNAGSSIDAILQASLGDRWMPFVGSNDQNTIDFNEIVSHLMFYPSILGVTLRQFHLDDNKNLEVFPIVFLRHPLDRILSIYESGSWKNNKRHELCSSLTLQEFCRQQLFNSNPEYNSQNYQAKYLMRANASPTATPSCSDVAEDTDMCQIEAFLEKARLVGIVDRYAESLRVLQAVTPPVFEIEWQDESIIERSGTVSDLNTRLNFFRNQVGSEMYGMISDLNNSDLALYEKYSGRLDRMSIPSISIPAIQFTGERFVPGNKIIGNDTQQEHLLRYRAVAPLATGKRVLDAACGEGYGSAILSDFAQEVVGLDLSVEVIMHARDVYGQRSNLSFTSGSVIMIPFHDSTFDMVVSFETIEHIDAKDQDLFLSEVRRVLRPDGLFIVSTPNRVNYSDRPCYNNEFHVHELAPDEFKNALSQFRVHCVYFQSMMAFSAIWHPVSDTYRFNGGLVPDEQDDTFLIAVCGREQSTAPAQSLCSLSYDRALSYAHLRANLIEKEQMISRLSSWGQDLDRIIIERDARILALQSEVNQLGTWGKERDRAVADRDQRIAELKAEIDNFISLLNLAPRSLFGIKKFRRSS